MFHVAGNATAIGLIIANAGWIAIVASYAISTNRSRRALQRELQIQRWHLQQTIPDPTQSRFRSTKV
jgi:hypothetical protein